MKPEHQRVAIAEACGWTEIEPCTCCDGVSRAYEPTPGAHKKHLPDFYNDLNAMHEAENILNADQMVSYDYHLDRVVGNGRQGLNIEYFLWSATASQRAEAFLRTIGKWEESK